MLAEVRDRLLESGVYRGLLREVARNAEDSFGCVERSFCFM